MVRNSPTYMHYSQLDQFVVIFIYIYIYIVSIQNQKAIVNLPEKKNRVL